MTRPEYETWHTLRAPALQRLKDAARGDFDTTEVLTADLVRCLETLAGFEANYRRELQLQEALRRIRRAMNDE